MKENINVRADGTAEFFDAAEASRFLSEIKLEACEIVTELIEASSLKAGQILVVGCSSSEVTGNKIGKASVPSVANAILDGMLPVLGERGIFLAAQCCEHLNRAIIVEREAVDLQIKCGTYTPVNVVPQPKAGGSFATAAYKNFKNPVALEGIRADCGLDIGGTLIGMHLRPVAVPVRLSVKNVGEAILIAARCRAKFIGGCRATYDESLL